MSVYQYRYNFKAGGAGELKKHLYTQKKYAQISLRIGTLSAKIAISLSIHLAMDLNSTNTSQLEFDTFQGNRILSPKTTGLPTSQNAAACLVHQEAWKRVGLFRKYYFSSRV